MIIPQEAARRHFLYGGRLKIRYGKSEADRTPRTFHPPHDQQSTDDHGGDAQQAGLRPERAAGPQNGAALVHGDEGRAIG